MSTLPTLVFPPALKKGMVRLLKKGTFSAWQYVKRALSAHDDKQMGIFFKVLGGHIEAQSLNLTLAILLLVS